jgi:hypothetical protein
LHAARATISRDGFRLGHNSAARMYFNTLSRRVAGKDPEARLVLVLSITAALVTFWLFRNLRHDDAYITMQYARNVATGRGFVFNFGERVLGATSPLHVLLLAAIYFAFGDVLPTAAIFISGCAIGVQAYLLFLLVRETNRFLGWVTSLLVVAGAMGSYSYLALETNLLGALVLGVVLAFHRRRETLGGVLLGLAFLCRYDAGLLVPICVTGWWLRDRVVPGRLLVTAFAVVTPWLVWSTLYFGSAMPQTFFAKQHITPPFVYLGGTMIRLANSPWFMFPETVSGALAYLTPLFWTWGAMFIWWRARQVVPLCAYGLGLLIAYSWIGPTPNQNWHLYATQMTTTLLFVLATVGWLVSNGAGRKQLGTPRAIAAATVAGVLVLGSSWQTVVFARSYRADLWLGKRHERYLELSKWLDTHIRPGLSVLPLEVGTIGYVSGFRMIDPYGLINRTNAFARAETREQTLRDLLELTDWYHPDVLILLTPNDGAFFEARTPFRVVQVFDWDPWSTILVSGPDALGRPADFEQFREALPDRARAVLRRADQAILRPAGANQ